jgi:hypothetical protein
MRTMQHMIRPKSHLICLSDGRSVRANEANISLIRALLARPPGAWRRKRKLARSSVKSDQPVYLHSANSTLAAPLHYPISRAFIQRSADRVVGWHDAGIRGTSIRRATKLGFVMQFVRTTVESACPDATHSSLIVLDMAIGCAAFEKHDAKDLLIWFKGPFC